MADFLCLSFFCIKNYLKKGFKSINIYVKDIDTYVCYDFYYGLKVINKCEKKNNY